MYGMPVPETFHAYDTVHHHRLTILVDDGSTHNFIQTRVATFLPMLPTPITSLEVMVGNDGVMECTQYFPQVPITIQNHSFTADLYALPLSGADIVLGVQWLKQLGPLTTNYANISMSFTFMGHPIQLIADIPLHPGPASAHQLKRMLQTQALSALFHLTPYPNTHHQHHSSPSCSLDTSPPPTEITILISRYHHLFDTATQLPPRLVQSPTVFTYNPTPTPSMLSRTVIPIARKPNWRIKSKPCSKVSVMLVAIHDLILY